MSWEAWVVCGIVVALLVALARNVAATDALMLSAFTLVAALRIVSDKFPSPRQLASSFGNEGLATVAVLYVVAAGLTQTGAASMLAGRLLGRPKSTAVAQARLMLPTMVISAFLNNTPVVAMLVPVVKDWCKSAQLEPSKLFLPLSYAAILGGVCTLIGTSTNLVVQGLLIEAGEPGMGMLTLAPIGLPVAVVGFCWVLIGSKLFLPPRTPAATRLGDPREYTVEMRVEPKSPLDGMTIERAGLRHLPGLFLVEVDRAGEPIAAPPPTQVLHGGDRLVFVGLVQSVLDLQKVRGLVPATDQVFKLDTPRADRAFIEVVVSPGSPIVGRTIRDARFRNRYDAAVIAVHRNGDLVRAKIGDIVLHAGDTLLIEAHPEFVDRYRDTRDFRLVSGWGDVQPIRHERAFIATGLLAVLVVVASLETVFDVGLLPIALLVALGMVALRCCTMEQARKSIEWHVLLTIGAAFGLAAALESTGAATAIADVVLVAMRPFGPIGMLAAVYFITLVLTELVTNNAAAVLAFPIAKSAAAAIGAPLLPFAVCIAVAASSGFATPMGYQTHMMVYGAGGYTFGDFMKMGLVLDALVMAVTVALVPVFFPL